MKLTNDDKYEIEKALDIQAGWITSGIERMTKLSLECAINDRASLMLILDQKIRELQRSYETHKRIRDKFEKERENNKSSNKNYSRVGEVPSPKTEAPEVVPLKKETQQELKVHCPHCKKDYLISTNMINQRAS